jgi:hypothetical protein
VILWWWGGEAVLSKRAAGLVLTHARTAMLACTFVDIQKHTIQLLLYCLLFLCAVTPPTCFP